MSEASPVQKRLKYRELTVLEEVNKRVQHVDIRHPPPRLSDGSVCTVDGFTVQRRLETKSSSWKGVWKRSSIWSWKIGGTDADKGRAEIAEECRTGWQIVNGRRMANTATRKCRKMDWPWFDDKCVRSLDNSLEGYKDGIYLQILRRTGVLSLCYKSEGRWFDSSWCHWNFSLT